MTASLLRARCELATALSAVETARAAAATVSTASEAVRAFGNVEAALTWLRETFTRQGERERILATYLGRKQLPRESVHDYASALQFLEACLHDSKHLGNYDSILKLARDLERKVPSLLEVDGAAGLQAATSSSSIYGNAGSMAGVGAAGRGCCASGGFSFCGSGCAIWTGRRGHGASP